MAIKTYEVATSGAALTPLAGHPVRLYTTGSDHGRVVRCTGGMDNVVVGIAKASVVTAGRSVPVDDTPGHRFLGNFATTIAVGAKVKIKNGTQFVIADAQATGTGIPSRYTASVAEGRTNTGRTWLEFQPQGVV
jgi:hypothetical protein